MEINFNEIDVLNSIKNNLDNKIPFLITRLGEGEIRMFLQNGHDTWIIKRMIGYVPNENHMEEIRSNLELTLINSNITGLPNFKGMTNETDVMNSEIDQIYKETYGVFKNIFKKHGIDENSLNYCSVNVHSEFKIHNLYEDIFNHITDLTIITCRDVGGLIKKKYPHIKNIEVMEIPPEYRFEDDPTKIHWNFYPEIHNNIKDSILNKDNSGRLCLYGAGIVGKDFGYYFKQSGGVAFDIGSHFDHMYGKRTRGPGKGRHQYADGSWHYLRNTETYD
jgi:hypothetical protein